MHGGVELAIDHADDLEPVLAIDRTDRSEHDMRDVGKNLGTERERETVPLYVGRVFRGVELDVHEFFCRYILRARQHLIVDTLQEMGGELFYIRDKPRNRSSPRSCEIRTFQKCERLLERGLSIMISP